VDMGYKSVSNVGAIGDWENKGGPMNKWYFYLLIYFLR
jgi:hypothetical protein